MRVAAKRRRKRDGEAGFRASLYLEFPRLLVAPYLARRVYESRVTRFKRRPAISRGERVGKNRFTQSRAAGASSVSNLIDSLLANVIAAAREAKVSLSIRRRDAIECIEKRKFKRPWISARGSINCFKARGRVPVFTDPPRCAPRPETFFTAGGKEEEGGGGITEVALVSSRPVPSRLVAREKGG